MKKGIIVIGPKKKERNLKSSKITREEIKEKYLPLIFKHIRPLKFISKRRNSLASLNELTKENKFKKLYFLISNKYFLIQALGNISSNKGSLTPGINTETIDGMSLNRIDILSEKLKTGKFKFQPYRRKFVPKPTKKGEPIKYRPLGIPNFEDRVVQSAIQMILEAIYEPIFENINLNFGFRPEKSPHNAIQYLKTTGTGCDFAIEGDIKGAFDYVDPSTMVKILEKRIDDRKFIDLIKQGFKCGLMDQGIYKDTLLSTPQGGIASPILFNIYMHEFDLFIKNELNDIIEKKNNFEKRTRIGANNKIYTAISQRIYRWKKSLSQILKPDTNFFKLNPSTKEKIKMLQQNLKKEYRTRSITPSVIQSKRSIRIFYCRYADDWIIFTNANRNFSNKIVNLIETKLKNDLNLELNRKKTKITNLKNDKACFLGFSLYTYRKPKIHMENNKIIRTSGYQILIGIDMDRMLNKLTVKGFCRIKSDHRPISKGSLTVLTYEQIINTYNYIIRGTGNYFIPMIDRCRDIIRVIYILEYSAMMTIEQKMNSKISKIREKFKKPVIMEISQKEHRKLLGERETTKKIKLLDYLTTKDLVEELMDTRRINIKYAVKSDIFNPLNKINGRTLRNLSMACCVCGSTENVEMHHVHAIRKGKVIGFTQILKQLNRKQIPLCKPHHLAAKKGQLTDIKIDDLYFLEEYLA